ncbi:MAG: FAD-dependent protein, partial [bacterium]
RDSKYANSGIVVAVEKEDLKEFENYGEFSGLEYQKQAEHNFFKAGDGSQKAPAQRMTDFVKGKVSKDLSGTSYIPGIYSSSLDRLLPAEISERIKVALIEFGKKMRGYFTEEGILIGLESRTSSPVRIPRDKISYQHPEIKNLFPCGEGAGYAGGIISAALDGQNTARAITDFN